MLLATMIGAHLVACGGSKAGPPNVPSGGEEEANTLHTVAADHTDAPVTSIAITPTEEEAAGGGMEVTIRDTESVSHWVNSDAFSSEGWNTNGEKLQARYRVVFLSEEREVARFYLGTKKGDPIKYRCFGFCATWWVAPSTKQGEQDLRWYRVMSDTTWHPLAREWYMSSR